MFLGAWLKGVNSSITMPSGGLRTLSEFPWVSIDSIFIVHLPLYHIYTCEIYIYVCVCIHVYIYEYIRRHVSTYIYIYTHNHKSVYIYNIQIYCSNQLWLPSSGGVPVWRLLKGLVHGCQGSTLRPRPRLVGHRAAHCGAGTIGCNDSHVMIDMSSLKICHIFHVIL